MPLRLPMPNRGWKRCARIGPTLLVLGALLSGSPTVRLSGQQRSAYEELQTFSGVLNHVRLNYVDSVTYTQLVRAAIDGVLRALDPHSLFISRDDWERRNALERGELAVTGLSFEAVDSAITVLSVSPRSPAARAGVLPGDRLATLNDTAVAGLDVEKIALRMAGEKGSKVRLQFERGPRLEPDTFTVTLKRDFLRSQSVSIARMADPGGYVIAAVELASEFLPKGTVVFRTRGRKKDVDTTYTTKRDGDFRELPMVVLIDGYSASAAEALSASLQDHDRALILGRRSFGKALMQADFLVLPNGDDLHLTIGYVLSPSGRFIQRRYHGLAVEQYRTLAGRGGAAEDTLQLFHTDNGRPVRGGGGVAPDVTLAPPPALPVWWSVAADSGFDFAVADSVALALPATLAGRDAWMTSPEQWRVRLASPFLDRVRARLHVTAQVDTALEARLARFLALRAAEVRWGAEARDEFLVRASSDIRAAIGYFPRLGALLAAPAR